MSNGIARKEIKAAAEMKRLMAEHFLDLDRSVGKEIIAWCTSVGPAELLHGFGFKVYYPENHGAILGTGRKAMDYIPVSNAAGYSPEVCSYLTSDIGAYMKKETPLTRAYGIKSVPKPDVLVYNTNQCRDVQEWLSFYSREFGVPLLGINSPKYVDVLNDAHINSVASQLEAMVEPLEKISGRKFDIGEFKRVLSLSLEAAKLWKAVLETASNVPSPLTFFDGTIHMGPIVVLRGTKQAVDYYKLLLKEMEDRVRDGVAAVDGENYRLYWDGMPIWGKLRELSELFASLRTCIVASTYCNSWIFDELDPNDPFKSMAKAYTNIFINRAEAAKEKYIEEMVRKFKIDGIIFHDSKTCANNTNSRYGMPGRLQKKLSISTLVIYGDLNDLRCYSEEQTKTNIEAFIEQLEAQ